MDTICLNCDKPFEAKRKTAKFCSDTCRQAYKRKDKLSADQPITSVKQVTEVIKELPHKPTNRMSQYLLDKRKRKLKID